MNIDESLHSRSLLVEPRLGSEILDYEQSGSSF